MGYREPQTPGIGGLNNFTTTEEAWVQNGAAGDIRVLETSGVPASDIAGTGRLYVKSSDSLIYYKTDAGVEYSLTASGASTAGTAPISATYLTLSLDNTLTNERVLTAGGGISITDTGANGSAVIANIGVTSLTAGSGMVLSASTGGITVTNNGILTLVSGTGISVSSAGTSQTITNTGILTLSAGVGISVTSAGTTQTILNAGVTTAVAGTGISVSAAVGQVTFTNIGVTSLSVTGAGITVSASTGGVSLANTGVTTAVAGTGITVSAATGQVTFTNSGVTTAVAGTGISLSAQTGQVTFTNIGVQSLTAGTGISVSSSTGGVTVTNIGVTSIIGTSTGVLVSVSTGAVALSLPQAINTTANVTFATANVSYLNLGLASAPTAVMNATGQYVSNLYNIGSITSAFTVNWNNGNVQFVTLTNTNATATFSNPQNGGRYMLIVKHSSASSTINWPSIIAWSNASEVVLTTTAGTTDVVTFGYINTAYVGSGTTNFLIG